MATLKEHIDVLQRLALDGVPARELGLYYYHLFNIHLAGDKGDHLADHTGNKVTIEEFFKLLETPDPPEAPRNWAHRGETIRAIKGHVNKATTPQGTKVIQGLRNPEPRRQT
jgi:hypothetical protein